MGAIATSAGPLRVAMPFAAAIVLVLAAFAGLLGVAAGFDTCTGGDEAGPSAAADRDIPARYLTTYRTAGSEFGVPWQVLAAIGAVETDHGRLDAPGVRSGVNNYGCCAGPMQFNLTDGPPSTWQRYGVDGDHDGTKDVHDPDDAIPSAANYLRTLLRNADGDLRQAIFGYNHSPRVRQRRPRPRPHLRRRRHRGRPRLRERHRRARRPRRRPRRPAPHRAARVQDVAGVGNGGWPRTPGRRRAHP